MMPAWTMTSSRYEQCRGVFASSLHRLVVRKRCHEIHPLKAAQLTAETRASSTDAGSLLHQPTSGPLPRKEETMNNEYVVSDLIEIGSAEENIQFDPTKDSPFPEEAAISRPSNG